MDTHRIEYRGESRVCNPNNYSATVAELIALKGEPTIDDHPVVTALPVAPVAVVTPPPPAPVGRGVGNVDEAGAIRASLDEDLARTNGFAPKAPLYEVGTRVVQMGVDNARAMQQEHDAKPWARDVAADLVRAVRAEERQDLPATRVGDLRMTSSGLIVLPGEGEPGKGPRLPLSERSFASLMGRMPARSGIAYLNDCPPKLRAINFNHWAVEVTDRERSETKPMEAVLRTRKVEGVRQAFAAVSPTYTPFDADKIGEALRLALPGDAKGGLDYDGQRMRLEALWRTNIAPDEFVAGEFFKAGVIVRADDTGAGSIRVQSVLWRNLCLNLLILDKAVGVDIRLRHVGNVEELAARFRAAFNEALGSIGSFRNAWKNAMQEEGEALVARSAGTTADDIAKLPANVVLAGLFNGILERELVPVKGRKTDVVPKLLEMHTQDEARDAYGVSRASIVNAFTRYAHKVETDPFAADLIREGAGTLLSGTRGRAPAPLPYVAFAA